MYTKKLIFRNGTAMQLFVSKDVDGFYGELSLVLKNESTYSLNKRRSGFEFNLEEHENEVIPCKYIDGSVYDVNDNRLMTYDHLFDTDRIATLVKVKNGAVIMVGDKNNIVGQLTQDELPVNLFRNRNYFPVNIQSDDKWTIVRYANIHQHTEYSLLDGIVRIKDLAKKTEYACAITDHGNMYGFREMLNEMKKARKKAIIGEEFYIETLGGPRRFTSKSDVSIEESMFDSSREQNIDGLNSEHLIVLAKNDIGLKNLFKLSTYAFDHVYRKPHITYDLLEQYHEGLIVTSACIAGTLGQSIKHYLKAVNDSKTVKNLIKENGPFFYLSNYNSDDNDVNAYIYNHRLARQYIEKMIELFGDDFYLEIQDHKFELETVIMDEIKKIQKEEFPQVKLVVGGDAHYLNKEDEYIHEVWLCNQTKKTMSDPKRMKFEGEGYFVHTSDEMVVLFKDNPDALDNTLEIAEKVNYSEEKNSYHLPHYPLPEGFENAETYFKHMCSEGYKYRFAGTQHYTDETYLKRMKTEIDVITKMGWPSYFLIVQDFIAWAKDDKVKENLERYFPSSHFNHNEIPEELVKDYEILIGPGRGSAAGSLVSYCLGITEVDPIEYDLLFERFLNPDRISMPDIDTDIEDAGRQAVLAYIRYKYRPDHVSAIITFGTSAAKDAVRRVARCLGFEPSFGDSIAKMIPDKPGTKLRDVIDSDPEFDSFLQGNVDAKKVVDIALKWEGLKTNASQHACGTLITDVPIVEYMPECRMKNPKTKTYEWVAQVEGSGCEALGCLKMDLLGLRTLGYVHEALTSIERNTGKKISYNEIPLDDMRVYQHLADGHTASIFQLESSLFTSLVTQAYQDIDGRVRKIKTLDEDKQKALLQSLGDTCFGRLVDMNALVRPGPNAYIKDYCNNILNPEDIEYDISQEKEILSSTYGIILYQEQVMNICKQFAGFSAGQADTIRKAMGKKIKSIIDEYGEYFVHGSKALDIKGCVNNGIPEQMAVVLWKKMEKFCEYAFNRSHAVSYSYHSIKTAWLSYYYPYEYMTAVLNSYARNAERLQQYLNVCKTRNIKILPPSINESMLDFSTDGHAIRIGLSGLRNVGDKAELILEERQNGKFKDLSDFLYRMAKYQKIDKRMLESFIFSGMLDEWKGTRKDKIEQMETLLEFISLVKELGKDTYSIFDAFDYAYKRSLSERHALNIDIEDSGQEYSDTYKYLMEKEYCGMYITGHPMDQYMDAIKGQTTMEIGDILMMTSKNDEDLNEDEGIAKADTSQIFGKAIQLAGIIQNLTTRHTKKGDAFITFRLEDTTGSIDAVYFPKNGSMSDDPNSIFLKDNEPVMVRCKLRQNDFGVTATVSKFTHLTAKMKSKAKHWEILINEDIDLTLVELLSLENRLKSGKDSISYRVGDDVTLLYENVSIVPEIAKALVNIVGAENIKKT